MQAYKQSNHRDFLVSSRRGMDADDGDCAVESCVWEDWALLKENIS